MQHVRGEYVIFADADGASKFDDLEKLERELKTIERDGLGIAVGSRAHMVHSAAVVQVPTTHHPLLTFCRN
jgi:dolichyl-phosphate beta-glucosyltransferase